jgi:hypothetical protein
VYEVEHGMLKHFLELPQTFKDWDGVLLLFCHISNYVSCSGSLQHFAACNLDIVFGMALPKHEDTRSFSHMSTFSGDLP